MNDDNRNHMPGPSEATDAERPNDILDGGTPDERMVRRLTAMRRVSAWIMLALFVLLLLNVLFFHVMTALSAVVYLSLIAVFFLGNGMRGGAAAHGQLERDGTEEGKEDGNEDAEEDGHQPGNG